MTRTHGFGGGERCRKARQALIPGIMVLCLARSALGEEGAPPAPPVVAPPVVAPPVVAPPVVAPLREGVSEIQRQEARALFVQGVAELDVGRYAEALACFQRAYVLWDSPKILLNIATTLRALGQNARAATAYARYLGTVAPDDPRRDEVVQALRDVRMQLGRIVSSNLQGVARLWIDDEEIAAVAGREIWVQPGGHTLVAERMGGSRQTLRIRVAAGGVQSVDWTPPLPPQRSGPRRSSPVTNSKLRALARADFDLTRGGAVGAGGIAFDAREWLRVTGGALIGAQKGAWVGLESAPFGGRVGPVLGTSLPVFFVGPMYPGVSGELGVRFEATARIALSARAAVAHFPTVPSGYVKTLYVPSAGLEVGL